jgi:hypoxanthine-DNA glycosylase
MADELNKATPAELRERLENYRFTPSNEVNRNTKKPFEVFVSPTNRCLPPILGEAEDCTGMKPWLLILGSAPGQESINRQQYYAHPSNHFWKLIAEVFSMPSAEDFARSSYEQRVKCLQKRGVAVWDMCSEFARKGSLDADLRCTNPNDILGLLKMYPSIKVIALNGQKAAQLFRRHVGQQRVPDVHIFSLPSTSPAHAMKDAVKSKASKWSIVLKSRPPENTLPAEAGDL